MNMGLKEEVKAVIQALLIPHAKGLPLDKLCREYADSEGKQIPFRAMGYSDLPSFLRAIPDTVRVNRLPSGVITAQAVATEANSHIQEFVQGQNNSKSRSVRMMNNLLRNSGGRSFNYSASQRSSYSTFGSGRPQYSQLYTHPNSRPMNRTFTGGTGNPVLDQKLVDQTRSNLETLLVAELVNLLGSFPSGVDRLLVASLYYNKFKKPLNFGFIQRNMSDLDFYHKHQEKFQVQHLNDGFVVSLRTPHQLQTNKQEANQASGQGNGSRDTSATRQTQLNGMPSNQQSSQSQAVDMPAQSLACETAITSTEPSTSEISGITVSSSNQSYTTTAPLAENTPQRKIIPISNLVNQPRKPRPLGSRGGALETFGVRKPDVADVCTPSTVIPHEHFPDVPEDDFFFIIVAEVYSPGRFYWFINHNRKAIEQLTDDLVLFYNLHDEYGCSLNEMYIGQLVAARYVDNLWYRAQVIGFQNGEFQLFYIDYGSSCSVTIDKIRHLPLHFTQLPVQAFRGELHGVAPASKNGLWSPESSRYFLSMIKGSKVIAASKMDEKNLMITENEYETCYSLVLIDTNTETDVNIAHRLVEENFAEICEDTEWDSQVSSHETVARPAPLNGAASTKESQNSSAMNGTQFAREFAQRLTIVSSDDKSVRVQELMTRIQEASVRSGAVNGHSLNAQPVVNSNISSTRRVKRLELNDGRVFFIIKDDGDLFLTKFDLLNLIPDIEVKMRASSLKIFHRIKESSTNSDLFSQCQMEGAPWIKDCDGNPVPNLVLFPLMHIPTVLFLFKKDRVASAAFEAELKNINDPYWEELFVSAN